jgi:hypothetical protein
VHEENVEALHGKEDLTFEGVFGFLVQKKEALQMNFKTGSVFGSSGTWRPSEFPVETTLPQGNGTFVGSKRDCTSRTGYLQPVHDVFSFGEPLGGGDEFEGGERCRGI